MKNISRGVIIFLLFIGGCSSSETNVEDSQLPWNRPAKWELKRDVDSSSLNFHKEYMPEDFNK